MKKSFSLKIESAKLSGDWFTFVCFSGKGFLFQKPILTIMKGKFLPFVNGSKKCADTEKSTGETRCFLLFTFHNSPPVIQLSCVPVICATSTKTGTARRKAARTDTSSPPQRSKSLILSYQYTIINNSEIRGSLISWSTTSMIAVRYSSISCAYVFTP